jgi:hypothetical protein
MLNDLLWLVYAYLAFVSIFAVPAALVWVVHKILKAHEQPKPTPESAPAHLPDGLCLPR